MAYYKVAFFINGELHFTGGEFSYPSHSDYINNSYKEETVIEIVHAIINGYLEVSNIPLETTEYTLKDYCITFQ